VGTSGFAYAEWKPDFYPADLKQAKFLEHYATKLPSVEINNTFYRAPTEALLAGWVERTPPGFCFTLKAPQRITHHRRLSDVDESLSFFLSTARTLGERLGAILFQCPPNLAYDADLLTGFLASLPGEPFRFAMEFRHPSWDAPEVRETLSRNGVAWCVADTTGSTPVVRTAKSFAYFRLRKGDYTEDELDRWASEATSLLDDGADVYAYLKHEDDVRGAQYALGLAARLASFSA
jgi:uncharacterized protein YecE (DUF72 family)